MIVRRWLADSLYRNSAALVVNTGVNAALGFAYWLTAARALPPADLGLGGVAVTGTMLAANFGWAGVQFVVLRYLPVAGSSATGLLASSYGVAVALAVVASIGLMALFGGDPSVNAMLENPLSPAAMVVAGGLWVMFSLQDAALTALRLSPWIPLENTVYGLAKLVLLVLLAPATGWLALPISWFAPTLVLVPLITAITVRRLRARVDAPRLPSIGRMTTFASGQHLIAMALSVPDLLLPLVVLTLGGSEASAYYIAAWTVAFSIRLVALNVVNAFTVEGAYRGEMHGLMAQAGKLLGAILVPLLLAVLLAADLVMSLFGRSYSDESSGLLRLFSIGLLPYSVTTFFLALERIRGRVSRAILVTLFSATTILVVTIWLVPAVGILGAGIAFVGGNIAGAAASLGFLMAGYAKDRPRRVAAAHRQ